MSSDRSPADPSFEVQSTPRRAPLALVLEARRTLVPQ